MNDWERYFVQLDYKVTSKKLKEVFALAGKVVDAELKEDKFGKSRGLGNVQFETPLEAVQAICILLFYFLAFNRVYFM